MDKKKIIYLTSSAILIILAAFPIIWITKQELAKKHKNSASGIQNQVSNKSEESDEAKDVAMKKEEADYKIESKEDANKAMKDLYSLVKSAGEASL